jgi:hypothetical protein
MIFFFFIMSLLLLSFNYGSSELEWLTCNHKLPCSLLLLLYPFCCSSQFFDVFVCTQLICSFVCAVLLFLIVPSNVSVPCFDSFDASGRVCRSRTYYLVFMETNWFLKKIPLIVCRFLANKISIYQSKSCQSAYVAICSFSFFSFLLCIIQCHWCYVLQICSTWYFWQSLLLIAGSSDCSIVVIFSCCTLVTDLLTIIIASRR